ncbi:MAG: L-serine ammonia-lyase, iron-sulfur-dependent, subunit alpha [Clostridia bacterium]|nr:L-serine ammonia-lyase, iron-sulfur-dependent, subunit alpha [Clostridia bacterium]
MQTFAEFLRDAAKYGDLAKAALHWQAKQEGCGEEALVKRMHDRLAVMRESAKAGLSPTLRSVSGMVGGQAAKMAVPEQIGRFGLLGRAGSYAMSIAEYNACMGKIVAAPTAGSCGILPGALLAAQETDGFTDDQLVMALFTAAGVGRIIALQATISGAEGGCQAECGAAAGMAAAALVQLYGGTPEMCAHACAFSLMNMLGLVCDPVHGLVEVPCVYRNVGGVSQALSAAHMALSGLKSPIPCDEVILAMKDVGDALPSSLRETGEGGCAACRSVCAGK